MARTPIKFEVDGIPIISGGSLIYLGLALDKGITYRKHVNKIAAKAQEVVAALVRLMRRISGAADTKRRLLSPAAISIMLYALTVWEKALNHKKILIF